MRNVIMQEAGGRKQEAGSRKQEAGSRKQAADGRKQAADGRKQEADGRRQAPRTRTLSLLVIPILNTSYSLILLSLVRITND
ncbi:MAG TPA: hypothetical protein VGL91_03340 [Acidobacteriota bacterium]|jgi:hypothetical protein